MCVFNIKSSKKKDFPVPKMLFPFCRTQKKDGFSFLLYFLFSLVSLSFFLCVKLDPVGFRKSKSS
ncbi:unnamed protein product [Meloidogyne enterolobii]|uniref:Uncharacterized protein n=1 Tax=Meloidogyne enterolobii TaxID=390850 RepID=A0ACB0ZRG3_MELEN